MSQQIDEESLMRKYLLGELDETQQEEVAERLLCDDDFAERLSAAQDHLIDDYVFDALTEHEKGRFDKSFIFNDERRRKILFAQSLEIYVEAELGHERAPREESNLPLTWLKSFFLFLREHKAWATVSLSILILLLFFTPKAIRWLQSNDQFTALQTRRANIERQIAELNQHRPNTQTQDQPAIELSLEPILLRGSGELPRVILAGDIKLLRLKLELPQVRYGSYRANVLTVEGDELFAVDLTPEEGTQAQAISLKIPTEFLPTGDYQIELKGIVAADQVTNAARYNFRVINNTAVR